MTASTFGSEKSIPLDVVLSALANEHRRAVLRSLNQTEGEAMQVSALVDQVAERIRDGEPPDDDHRQRVHVALHHIHLPQLEAYGMIVRDTETNQIRNGTDELDQQTLALIDTYAAC